MPLYRTVRHTFLFCVFVAEIVVQSSNAYELVCPENIAWTIRARGKCNNTASNYFCLKNDVNNSYVEGCDGPRTDRKGRKYLYNGGYIRERCNSSRYQPFKFDTQGSSECVFLKSLCNEEGQVSSNQSSFISNRLCYCDGDRGYDFVSKRDFQMACNDAYEDCSCFKRTISTTVMDGSGYNDYISAKPNPKQSTSDSTKPNTGHKHDSLSFSEDKWKVTSSKHTVIIFVLVCLIFILVTFPLFFVYVYEERNKIEEIEHGGAKENNSDLHLEVDGIEKELCFSHLDVFSMNELNYLMLVHLVFRVACPAVRVHFKHEISEDCLERILIVDKNIIKQRIGKRLSPQMKQLLWPNNKAKKVSSETFDISLMILLLEDIIQLHVSDRLPLDNDASVNSLLSRMKYMRNIVTQDVNGTLNHSDFKKQWKHTIKSVYQLLERHLGTNLDSRIITQDRQLVDRLKSHLILNDFEKFKWLNMCTESILHQIILEFCTSKKLTITELLLEEKHKMCHKRTGQKYCCVCSDKVFSSEIPDICWNILFDINNRMTCNCETRTHQCGDRIQVKDNLQISTFDFSLLKCLIFNVSRLSRYAFTRLYKNDLQLMLSQHQHIFYHAFEKAKCCECTHGSEKNTKCLSTSDFLYLFDRKMCRHGLECTAPSCKMTVCNINNCCCKFTPKAGIEVDDIDDNLLHKIIRQVFPFSVMSEIETSKTHEFYKFMRPDKSLKRSVQKLSEVVMDRTCIENVGGQLCDWTYSQEMNVPLLTALYDNLYDNDTLLMREKYSEAEVGRTTEIEAFIDLDKEENNFLLVFYALKKVVYPAVRAKVNRLHETKLPEMQGGIQDGLTHKDFECRETSSNKDLESMIMFLNNTRRDNTHVLKNLKSVHHSVVTNSSGKISGEQFSDYWKLIRMALIAIDGDSHLQRLEDLKKIANIFAKTRQPLTGMICKNIQNEDGTLD